MKHPLKNPETLGEVRAACDHEWRQGLIEHEYTCRLYCAAHAPKDAVEVDWAEELRQALRVLADRITTPGREVGFAVERIES